MVASVTDLADPTAATAPGSDAERVAEAVDRLLAEHPPASTPPAEFLGAQFDAGLAWVHFPEGEGGLGLTPGHQKLIQERLAAAGAPHPAARNPIGYGMGAPTVATHGSEAQRSRYLRPLFTGAEVWCQMFSEPGAGSDVASLSTRAVRDGDEWIVNGQKVWTTVAHLSRGGMLIARTDPEQPKHRGMTYFVVDMEAPGVAVRPLRQLTGEAEFNEVYFTDVRIPDDERLSDVGEGWRVSITTLMNERVSIGGTVAPRGSGLIATAVKTWLDADRTDAVARDRLAKLWCEAEALRLTNVRASQNRKRGTPGPEGSVAKLMMAELNQRIASFVVNLLGPAGGLYGGYTFERPRHALDLSSPVKAFLRVQANSIEGGTSNIMRNVL